MAKVGAQRAAIMTGRSKSTIQRAMKAGRLSFEIDDQGQKLVDISELERVFGPVTEQEENTSLAAVKAGESNGLMRCLKWNASKCAFTVSKISCTSRKFNWTM